MVDRIDVVALKPLSLGGVDYKPGDRIAMGAARVRQYEVIARMGRGAMIRRLGVDEAPAAADAAPPPPARVAAVVNAPTPIRRYRTRRLKAEV